MVTHNAGLYAVRYEELFGERHGRHYPVRRSRRGKPVAFHLSTERFGPGTTLYFWSDGASANPDGNEAVYELERGDGLRMPVDDVPPSGELVSHVWTRLEQEESHLYQATLIDAEDLWLWDYLFAPDTKSFTFNVAGLGRIPEGGRARVEILGASDSAEDPDHHVRVSVNGTFLGEDRFDGKAYRELELELPPGVLVEGTNSLEIENVGDTDAAYSMVMLDRYDVTYPRELVLEGGVLEGRAPVSGTIQVDGASFALDVTGEHPVWLNGAHFRANARHRYRVFSAHALLSPGIRRVQRTNLRKTRRQIDYLVIGPQAFIDVAAPLLSHRASQGLAVKSVSGEDIFTEFGHGEKSPEAIQAFLTHAYHLWKRPSVRYVLLLGDASYDPKDFLQTGVASHLPSPTVRTSYLWTVSDLVYASVNGDDRLPDLAIGRLPAASVDEARQMVEKILAYERGDPSRFARVVLVSDDPDEAGNFIANAEELAASVLAGVDTEKIYLPQLGSAGARQKVVEAFDRGSSVMSYVGHGGIHLWADEQIFRNADIASLSPQADQPILLTMNCLNGYFQFPYFDTLSEKLLKQPDRGVVAAISPSGLSLDAPAHQFHRAILEALRDGHHETLGDAFLAAQEVYADSGAFPELLGIYHFLGDPALRLD